MIMIDQYDAGRLEGPSYTNKHDLLFFFSEHSFSNKHFPSTIDTEIKAKRNNMISELITFRITKAKAKVKFGVQHLCKHKCERSFVTININTKAKAEKYSRGINFTLISVATVF